MSAWVHAAASRNLLMLWSENEYGNCICLLHYISHTRHGEKRRLWGLTLSAIIMIWCNGGWRIATGQIFISWLHKNFSTTLKYRKYYRKVGMSMKAAIPKRIILAILQEHTNHTSNHIKSYCRGRYVQQSCMYCTCFSPTAAPILPQRHVNRNQHAFHF